MFGQHSCRILAGLNLAKLKLTIDKQIVPEQVSMLNMLALPVSPSFEVKALPLELSVETVSSNGLASCESCVSCSKLLRCSDEDDTDETCVLQEAVNGTPHKDKEAPLVGFLV